MASLSRLPALLLAALVLGTAAGVVPAAKDKPTRDEVARLIARLGSKKYTERQAAARALDALGAVALPDLTRAAASPDAEIRRQAKTLVKKISKRLETEQLLAATRVHFVWKDTPVTTAVAELAKKTGFRIEVEAVTPRLAARKITLDTGETTFWQAFDQLCQKGQLKERGLKAVLSRSVFPARNARNQPDRAPPRLVLVDEKPPELPTQYVRGLRVRVLPPNLPRGDMPRVGEDRLIVVEAALEPRLRLDRIIGLRIGKAIDERGIHAEASALPIETHDNDNPYGGIQRQRPTYLGRLEYGMDEGNFRRLLVRVTPSRRLTELRGTLMAEVQQPSKPVISVDNILKAAGQSFAAQRGESLKVVRVENKDNGQVVLELQTVFPIGNAVGGITIGNGVIRIRRFPGGKWEAVGLRPDNLQLLDTAGRQYRLTGRASQGVSFNPAGITQRLRLTYTRDKGLTAPAKLVYIGLKTTVVEVPFELKDVPLQ